MYEMFVIKYKYMYIIICSKFMAYTKILYSHTIELITKYYLNICSKQSSEPSVSLGIKV